MARSRKDKLISGLQTLYRRESIEQYCIINPAKIEFLYKKEKYDICWKFFILAIIFLPPIFLLYDENRKSISFILAGVWMFLMVKDLYKAMITGNTVQFDFVAANISIIPKDRILKQWKKEQNISFQSIENIKPTNIYIGRYTRLYRLFVITKSKDQIPLLDYNNEMMAHKVAFVLNNLIKIRKEQEQE